MKGIKRKKKEGKNKKYNIIKGEKNGMLLPVVKPGILTRKMVPITGRARSFLLFLEFSET